MMRFFFSFVVLMSAAPAFAKYASIAYNKDSGRWGEAHGYSDLNQAQSVALDYCGASCFTAVWVQNAYAVLANDPSNPGIYGWAWNTSKNRAIRGALDACNRNSPNGCNVLVWVYSGTGY